jgi:Kef-type K+ transport system membrane component KefB
MQLSLPTLVRVPLIAVAAPMFASALQPWIRIPLVVFEIVLGVVLGVLFAPNATAGVFVGIALTSTALGTIMPVLRDAGETQTPFGTVVLAVGAAGEFGPLIAIALFLSARSRPACCSTCSWPRPIPVPSTTWRPSSTRSGSVSWCRSSSSTPGSPSISTHCCTTPAHSSCCR